MTDKQPIALRLADLIDQNLAGAGDAEIAAELRRLHDELIDAQAQRNAAFHSIEHQRDLLGKANALNRIRYERVKLLTGQRDELLDALRKIEQQTVDGGRIHKLARAAIAKAEGTAND